MRRSAPISVMIGIGKAASEGILFRNADALQQSGKLTAIILDKTGTITEGSRSATRFVPLQKYKEVDVGQAAFAASIHDTSHEGKSIVDLAEEKKIHTSCH